MFNKFYQHYHSFQETSIKRRRITEEAWESLILKWKKEAIFIINELGTSEEGRPIREIIYGKGPIKIALWSQMHGDEATATMAIADILLFLSQESKEFAEFRKKLHQNLTIHILPKLNPDGAERWQRETALGIDMNRDAQTLFTKEAQILSKWTDNIQPLFAFNLHDQNRLYSAGNKAQQTHIAFLATPGDDKRTWTTSRTRAAKLANRLIRQIKPYLENKIARWSDEYERRAFGDTFQSRGYGLLLIESGGAGWDLEKQLLRKHNACIILDAFYAISEDKWQEENTVIYEELPMNEKSIVDIKIKQTALTNDPTRRADLLFRLKETPISKQEIKYSWLLEDIGDMSHIHGLIEIDGKEFELAPSQKITLDKVYEELIYTKQNKIVFQLSTYTNKIQS
jgi:hypothetical protein